MAPKTYFTAPVATAVIIANMIGTGVFTSLGYQLSDLQSGFSLIMLWVLGGVTAFCGAMCYAELGARLPRSGGEYNFLSEGIHPSIGFVSGWISATIGFAAPTALVAITFGTYLQVVFPMLNKSWCAAALVVVLAMIHARNRNHSANTQYVFTVLKIILILAFCGAALLFSSQSSSMNFMPNTQSDNELLSSEFAVALIYVSYSYSGWNAATYFSSELKNPQKSLPWILISGSAVVTLLYVLLNYTFLKTTPADAMRGQLEIVHIVAEHAFGSSIAIWVSLFLSVLLVSSVSAMLLAAPRVLQVIGEDFKFFRFLAKRNRDNIPYVAIYLQAAVALFLIATATFETILVFSGFILALNTLATVCTLFVWRWRRPHVPRPFSAWGYPLTPLIFLTLTTWTIVHIAINRPTQAVYGMICVLTGLVVYFLVKDKP